MAFFRHPDDFREEHFERAVTAFRSGQGTVCSLFADPKIDILIFPFPGSGTDNQHCLNYFIVSGMVPTDPEDQDWKALLDVVKEWLARNSYALLAAWHAADARDGVTLEHYKSVPQPSAEGITNALKKTIDDVSAVVVSNGTSGNAPGKGPSRLPPPAFSQPPPKGDLRN